MRGDMLTRLLPDRRSPRAAQSDRIHEALGLGASMAEGTYRGKRSIGLRYDVTLFGAKGDGTDDTAAFSQAIAEIEDGEGGTIYIPAGVYAIDQIAITKDNITLEGSGARSTILLASSASGQAIIVDLSAGTPKKYAAIRDLTIRPSVNQTSGYLVDVVRAPRFHAFGMFIDNDGGGTVAGGAGALQLKDVNYALIEHLQIDADETDRFAVGVDIANGVSDNRGNITFVGGALDRCLIGARIGKDATTLVNNIQFLGTKFLLGNGAQGVGVGIDIHPPAESVGCYGVHLEGYDVGLQVDSSRCVIFEDGNISQVFSSEGTHSQGVRLLNAVEFVRIQCSRIVAGPDEGGTAYHLDASDHSGVFIGQNRHNNWSTILDDNTTSGGLLNAFAITGAGAGRRFWFNDDVLVERFLRLGPGSNGDPAFLTIAGGVITPTGSYHRVDTESSASTDDLDTINDPGVKDGAILVLRPQNDTRSVVVKHATGNIHLNGQADFTMDNILDVITLLWLEPNSVWVELSRSDNGT